MRSSVLYFYVSAFQIVQTLSILRRADKEKSSCGQDSGLTKGSVEPRISFIIR